MDNVLVARKKDVSNRALIQEDSVRVAYSVITTLRDTAGGRFLRPLWSSNFFVSLTNATSAVKGKMYLGAFVMIGQRGGLQQYPGDVGGFAARRG